jgi:FkbM family methyltransferase
MIDVGRYPDSQSLLGSLLRLPLRLIPRSTVVPILQGPLRGKRWIVGSGISRLWLGSYEPEKMQLAASLLHQGDFAFDIGANAGIYSLLFSDRVGPSGRVVAFEPSLTNIGYLRRHMALNDATNVSLVPAAVSRQTGKAMIDLGSDSSTGQISPDGALQIDTITLDDFVAEENCRPSLIKVDVEGAEVEVLEGASATLRDVAPLLLIATHSATLKAACTEFLEHHKYEVRQLGVGPLSDELVAMPMNASDRYEKILVVAGNKDG